MVDNVLQHRRNIDAHFGGDLRSVHGGQADDILDFLLDARRVGRGQVDLVEHRADLQVVFQSQVGVGQGLGFHPLGGVHHQHCPLAGGQRAGHLVVEVHMSRGVNEIETIGLAVLGLVVHAHRTGLDGDAPLPLQVHVVQQLRLHLALLHRAADLDHPVGQGGFAVVNVGDDGEVADLALVSHQAHLPSGKSTHPISDGARRRRADKIRMGPPQRRSAAGFAGKGAPAEWMSFRQPAEAKDMELGATRSMWAMMKKLRILVWSVIGKNLRGKRSGL